MLDLIFESTRHEFKLDLEIIKPKSWLKTVSAFANGIGGSIYFGISDKRSIKGLSNTKEASERITEFINSRISPKPIFRLIPFRENDMELLELEISSGVNTPYYYAFDGIREAYIRSGTSTMLAPDYILNELILRGSGQTYDSIVSKFRKEDFSFSYFEATYLNKTNEKIVPSDYYSFGLMNDEGFLTNAGCLLADQVIMRQSRIFCTHWTGFDKVAKFEAIDDKEFSGSLLRIMELALDFCQTNFRKAWYKTESGRNELFEYSITAITECIINALVHRNYNEVGSEISIDFFSDRLEITSPGGMIDGTILQGSIPEIIKSKRRNPIIADVFSRMKLMDRRGSGFNKIIDSTDSLFQDGASHAHFYSNHATFVAVLDKAHNVEIDEARAFARANARAEINAVQSKIIGMIMENIKVTYRELSTNLHVAETTITRNIRKLKELNILKRSDNNDYWIVNTSF